MDSLVKVIGVIQARTNSSRLPKKVLLPLIGSLSILEVIIHRVKESQIAWWLATTDNQADDELEILAKKLGIQVFRGSEDDVLSRFTAIGEISKADWVVRVTADNPFVSSVEINHLVSLVVDGKCNYDRICDDPQNRKYPLGYFPEILNVHALSNIRDSITNENSYHLTHVSSSITNYQTINLEPSIRRPNLRWTVDESLDLEAARNIYSFAKHDYRNLTYKDLIEICDIHPEECNLNSSVVQKNIEAG